jgi:hypothetical protein
LIDVHVGTSGWIHSWKYVHSRGYTFDAKELQRLGDIHVLRLIYMIFSILEPWEKWFLKLINKTLGRGVYGNE